MFRRQRYMKRWSAIVALAAQITLALCVLGSDAPCCKACCNDCAGDQQVINFTCCCLVPPVFPAQEAGTTFEVAPSHLIAALSHGVPPIKVESSGARASLLGLQFSGPSPPRLYLLNSTLLI